jgi:hypothetical protein
VVVCVWDEGVGGDPEEVRLDKVREGRTLVELKVSKGSGGGGGVWGAMGGKEKRGGEERREKLEWKFPVKAQRHLRGRHREREREEDF